MSPSLSNLKQKAQREDCWLHTLDCSLHLPINCGQPKAAAHSIQICLAWCMNQGASVQNQEISISVCLLQTAQLEEAKVPEAEEWGCMGHLHVCSVLANCLHPPIMWHCKPQLTAVKEVWIVTGHRCCLKKLALMQHPHTISTLLRTIFKFFRCFPLSGCLQAYLFCRVEGGPEVRSPVTEEEAAKVNNKNSNYSLH